MSYADGALLWAGFAVLTLIVLALETITKRQVAALRRRVRWLEHGDFCHCEECEDERGTSGTDGEASDPGQPAGDPRTGCFNCGRPHGMPTSRPGHCGGCGTPVGVK